MRWLLTRSFGVVERYKKNKRCLFKHGYTFLGPLPVKKTAKLKVEKEGLTVVESFLHGLTSSDLAPLKEDLLPLKDLIPQNSWSDARRVRIKLPDGAVPSLLKPLRRAAESRFKGLLKKRRDPGRCFR